MRPLTRSCFLLLILGSLFLLALPVLLGIFPRSLWCPPFPLHALTLIPLSLSKVPLSPILTLSLLMIWCFGQTALFLFLLARAAPAYLPTALSVALRPLFPFRQAQYVPVFPLKPAPFCTLFAGLSSTNKQSRSTPTSGPPPKVSARAPVHRSYHFRGVKLKSCIKKIHHNLYISKQANVKIKHADTEGASHKKFGIDARVQ